ncbi:MAG: hypothetical protein ACJASQ_000827 [Crocinitomicaceae bacterium]|jgi:hypothetical protein
MKLFFALLLFGFFCNVESLKAQPNLPDEVPPFSVSINGTPNEGYLFFSPIDMTNALTNYPSTVMILDEEGELLFYLPVADESAPPYTRKAVGNFQLHEDGRMSFTDGLFAPGSIYIMDSTFHIVDTLNCTPQYTLDGHDFVITQDGHYHLLAMEQRTLDASALITEGGQFGSANCIVTGHIIQEFDENKVLVGEWKSLDHFALSDIYSYYFTDPLSMDHAHINSLFVDYEGNYITSSRSLNEVTRIDRQTGQIIWRLGGKNNEFSFLIDTLQFTSQHDAQYYSDGRVVLFDNATNSIPDFVSRMLVYDLDNVNMTVTPSLSFQHPLNFPSGFMGSSRMLGSDNFIISWGGGFDYSLGTSIQEFDNLWNEVLGVDLEDGFVSYRALKSEIPWTINRPIIDCDAGSMELSTLETYDSYYWSTGDTTASIVVSNPGTYQVWTTAGDGYLSSEIVEVTDMNDLCQAFNSLNEIEGQLFSVYPVPTSDFITINWKEYSGNSLIEIYDPLGRRIYTEEVQMNGLSHVVDVREIGSGAYYLKITNANNGLTDTKRISIN